MLKQNERLDNLGNGYSILQRIDGYCFTTDSVSLSKFVDLKNNDTVVDFCSGSGIVSLMLLGRAIEEKMQLQQIINIELQKEYHERAERSVALNNISNITCINGDVKTCANVLPTDAITVITCNPPYMPVDKTTKVPPKNQAVKVLNQADDITIARHEVCITLEDIFASASKLLRTKGRFYLIHKQDRLADICYLGRINRLEVKEIKLISGGVALIKSVKDAKPGLKIT